MSLSVGFYNKSGFTIVELLVVVVVIGIISSITMIAYMGVSSKATEVALQSELSDASKQLSLFQVENDSGNYPDTIDCTIPDSTTNKCVKAGSSNEYIYKSDNTVFPQTYSLIAINGDIGYEVTNSYPPTPVDVEQVTLGPSMGGGDPIGGFAPNVYYSPASEGNITEWNNGSDAFTPDSQAAYTSVNSSRNDYKDFNMPIVGNTVQGIEVLLESSSFPAGGTISVALSKDGGNNFTAVKTTSAMTTLDTVYSLGGDSDLWGTSWTTSDSANSSFVVRVIANTNSNGVRIDALQARFKFISTGGGAGAGGAIR